jgi:hypothetical protein
MITDARLQEMIEAAGSLPDDPDAVDLGDALAELAARREAARWRNLESEPPDFDLSLIIARDEKGSFTLARANGDARRLLGELGYKSWRPAGFAL